MEPFDKMVREMAEKEEMIVPNGFDERIQNVLDSLPPKAKKKGLGAAKMILIAAAVCAALLCTAFAASPGLRGMLMEALGGFAPYAREQDSEVYTWNGFEFKVLSAMADEATIRVYVQAKDLEGLGRLDSWGENWLEGPELELHGIESRMHPTGWQSGSGPARYDEATQTAVYEADREAFLIGDLSGAEVWIDKMLASMEEDPWDPPVKIPIDVEIMPSKTVLRDIEANGRHVDEVKVSPLSIILEWEKHSNAAENMELSNKEVRVKMKDGTVIKSEHDCESSNGSYRNDETGKNYQMVIWCFADPVEPENVEGIYIGEDYFPVK